MSPPSCRAGRSRPAPWSASTCRSPPPSSARGTTPSRPTSCGDPLARRGPRPCAARELVTASPTYEVWVDRPRALYGSWYEFFPRSEGAVVGGRATHGTFRTAVDRLPAIADMGFDVVYLPPIHPIGRVNRKGRN